MASVPRSNNRQKAGAYYPNMASNYYSAGPRSDVHMQMPTKHWQMSQPSPLQGFPSNQQFIMMPSAPASTFVPQQQFAVMRVDPAGNYFISGYLPAQQYVGQWNVPDSRLNPNSREFVRNSGFKAEEKHRLESDCRSTSRKSSNDLESLSSVGLDGRNLSSDSLGKDLNAKLQELEIRNHSGDSGIAEISLPPSPTWSSDDEGSLPRQGGIKRVEKEALWTVHDDNLFWRKERRYHPSDSLCYAIVKQLEYYMSDEYLAKDKYLLRQIRCKKDGYVSIKLMASFKKMKKLAQDWPILRSAIVRKSKTIVVSSEGLRVRRLAQLSEELRKPRMITSVLAIRLPEEYNAVNRITSLFRVFGEIGYIRLLRPEKAVPVDLRNYATQVPDIGLSLCAIIEFESGTDSLSAVRILKQRNRCGNVEDDASADNCKEAELSAEDDAKLQQILNDLPDLGDMRLALLGPRVRRTLYRQDRSKSSDSLPSSRNNSLDSNAAVREGSPRSMSGSSSPTWRRPVVGSPTKFANVIREPRGPRESKGFQLKRHIGGV